MEGEGGSREGKEKVEKARENLELLGHDERGDLCKAEAMGKQVECAERDLRAATDSLDRRNRILTLAMDGLESVQKEYGVRAQCLSQLDKTVYKTEKSHIAWDSLSNLL